MIFIFKWIIFGFKLFNFFFFFFSKIYLGQNFKIPLKWIWASHPKWFYEKQANSSLWNDFYFGRETRNLTEISASIDPNGSPELILKPESRNFYIILTQRNMNSEKNETHKTYGYDAGFWALAKGINQNLQQIIF